MALLRNTQPTTESWETLWKKEHPSVRDFRTDFINKKILSRQPSREGNYIKKDNTAIDAPDTRKESAAAFNKRAYKESQQEAVRSGVEDNVREMYKHPLSQIGYLTPSGAAIWSIRSAISGGVNLYKGNYKEAGIDAIGALPAAIPAGKAVVSKVARLRQIPTSLVKVPTVKIPSTGYVRDTSPISKEMYPYLKRPESLISREEEVFRNSMGPEYKKKMEEAGATYWDIDGNQIPAPPKIIKRALPESDYVNKVIAAKRNPKPKFEQKYSFTPRKSTIIDINDPNGPGISMQKRGGILKYQIKK